MYIHLGSDVSVRLRAIVGIFDMETATVAVDTKAFLTNCEDTDCVTNISPDLPKSFVVCEYGGSQQLYISAVAAGTLRKRVQAGTRLRARACAE